ncbi:hypothetical protein RvY_03481 [Ramazzottius varieornatus]|uniref:Tc1-like transposase DDE domain-containing protein n=1 Tax=Ramazzottius varieornatus TaxID=947166 RepID=A0A1D1UXJ9_RAMVA|nr:hypothetical protein RvY_03481 [Ramazzottius varieornatus]
MTEHSVDISESTVKRRINEQGMFGRVARKKPFVNYASRMKRLNFVKMYVKEPQSFWNNVLWSDETKINLFGSDGMVRVWRKPGEEYAPVCTVPTVKHGGGRLIFWGCSSARGVGNLVVIKGNIDGLMYRNIMDQNVLQSAKKLKLKKGWHYQQDNDSKHTSIVSRDWIIEKKIKILQWAPYSPDLNPIEHLWSEVERQLKGRHPSNLEELEETVKEIWYGMDPEICAKLVRSIPNRLRKVKKNRGYPTKY